VKDESPPEAGRLIAELCRAHYARASELFLRLGLHRGQPGVLRLLWETDGRTPSELAEALHVQPATVTNMLNRMTEAGFVTRRPDPDDRRASRVYLADAGRAVQDEVLAAMRKLDAEALAGFSDDERAALREFLLRLRDNLRAARD
jgi:MarR family transcriptional regulator, organic hydroperoxide resistance regulator